MRSIFLISVLAACHGSDTTPDAPVDCALETRAEPFVVGVDKAAVGGKLDFKMISATPAPPARQSNSWTILVSSMNNNVIGAPVTGAAIQVNPWMPDHQHSNGIPVGVTEMAGGMYTLDPLFLGMPGYWEITLDVDAGAGVQDSVVYKICISP
jgi:hypothetical protein